jgi:DNA-binding CsgD family transcriptional regulator
MNANTLTESALLRQMPGFWIYTGLNHEIINASDTMVKLLGFSNLDQMLGLTSAETRCKAAEYADIFNEQYNKAMKEKKSLTIIDLHPFYEDNRPVMLLTQKTPVFDASGNTAGVIAQASEINQQKLINITLSIAKQDKKYNEKSDQNRSYTVVPSSDESCKLSNRELECVFFLIRGKTAANIAETLKISKRTVEYYLENIKNKFGCLTKTELIEKAIDSNFIDRIPQSFFQKKRNISVEI